MEHSTSLTQKLRRAAANLFHNLRYILRSRLSDGAAEEARLRSMDALSLAQQLSDILKHETDITSPPPKHLQIRVVGSYNPTFIESAIHICADAERILGTQRKSLTDFSRVLDFGCGCGRNTRALKVVCKKAEIFGTDIDPEAIGWLQEHGRRIGTFVVSPHHPPTEFAADFFDFVIGISVFTHLPEDMQFEWLAELQRITRPGGCLILTTHGQNHLQHLKPELRADFDRTGFAYQDKCSTDGLPDFYQVAFHRPDYIKDKWRHHFEVISVTEQGIGPQDAVLLRKREDAA